MRFLQERIPLCTGFKAGRLFLQPHCIGSKTLGE